VSAGAAALLLLCAEHLLPASSGRAWPGMAVLAGLLLAWGNRRMRLALVAAGAAAGLLAAALLDRTGVPGGLLHLLGTLGGALVAFRRLGEDARRSDLFTRAAGLRAFAATAALAALVPALLTAIADGWRTGGTSYLSNLLFLLTLCPAVALTARLTDRLPRRWYAPAVIRTGAMLALGTAATGLAIAAGAQPLSFLVLGAVLLATVRMEAAGAAAMTAVVTLVLTYAGERGAGPLAGAAAGPDVRFLSGQLLLGGCFLAGLPLALVLAGRAREARQARALADRLCLVVQNVGDVLFLLDGAGRWTYLNPAWEALSGSSPERSLGRSWLEQVDVADRETAARQAAAVLAGETAAFRHTLRFQAQDGPRWMELFLQSVTDGAGRPNGAAGSLRDVEERKRLEEHSLTARRAAEQRAREATLLASTDELTGIANRRAFLYQFDREIEAAIDYGWPLAVALFDVDHFKAVNDRFGHAVGDRVLQNIAARAVASVRGGDLVGRLGGEEFGILMPGSSAAEAAIVAERLRRAVQAPAVDGQALPGVTVSIGIAQREDQRAAEVLLATADRALYRAKDEGRNRIRVAA
jgi:diguanylate cyclase (GGDEF)-like protein/PAS domain S-box-containing protein